MAVKSNDLKLSDLLNEVENGKSQLPEFQRSWVWDDHKIKKLIESIASEFPMGAIMFLKNGGGVKFKTRTFEGVSNMVQCTPDNLVLDGQQRLTTLYQVFKSKNAVTTRIETNKTKTIKRYYYIDILKSLDSSEDRLDAIRSVPENRIVTTNIGREVELDLSTPEKEYENFMFPLNIIFSQVDLNNWMLGFVNHNPINLSQNLQVYNDFSTSIINQIVGYTIPVIELDKDTPKEAVCQIFENVNTGGVPLTVFELVTAVFASDDFNLRDDWNLISKRFRGISTDVLKDVDGTNFITAMTLLATYKKNLLGKGTVSCKKKDVLKLELSDYKSNRDILIGGFEEAAKFLNDQGIYASRDLPYGSQLIPLAVILAYDSISGKNVRQYNELLLTNWYWCGVFGELYGGANETRFALDVSEIFSSIDSENKPDTITRSNFLATRLLTMQSRNSAAYKGVMALVMQDSPLDFMSARKMSIASYNNEETDIHHIFPQAYCKKPENAFPDKKWNSVINKTPIYAITNRSIGGRAPSEYIKTMENKGLRVEQIDAALKSHMIAPELLRTDSFDAFIVDRAIKLLNRIEKATGKLVAGRDSDETLQAFGAILK